MSQNKIALVTGASGHMGKSVTTQLLNDGIKVVGTVQTPEESTDFDNHPAFEKYAIDVSNEAEVSRLVDYITKNYGQVDFAALLVGGFAMGSLAETSSADLEKMYRLNFLTAYLCCQKLSAQMSSQEQGGHVVLVGARPALDPSAAASMVSYALSKSLIFKLEEIINANTAETGVRCSVIVPSVLDTPPNRESMPDADFSDWVTPEQVAATVAFLASSDSDPLRETVLKLYGNA
ncbi:SDR family NAD(P)-dependent oxidoreductase [Tunicatimonas pelagia]|uniref:SDR family NAD(P)-dependent oxidoreductase n=1 Tax=Tunicatimonas pelagia TaxID=931531 RepID=UPI0026663DF4|nr:SDR family NAD(P)-dependent oxidoreductase [Tunicatimonas pelagia]WKN43231.1 SDR family NAD(P)-dependent oxidoreductase [Tunicatimonas pelagia]